MSQKKLLNFYHFGAQKINFNVQLIQYQQLHLELILNLSTHSLKPIEKHYFFWF